MRYTKRLLQGSGCLWMLGNGVDGQDVEITFWEDDCEWKQSKQPLD